MLVFSKWFMVGEDSYWLIGWLMWFRVKVLFFMVVSMCVLFDG